MVGGSFLGESDLNVLIIAALSKQAGQQVN